MTCINHKHNLLMKFKPLFLALYLLHNNHIRISFFQTRIYMTLFKRFPIIDVISLLPFLQMFWSTVSLTGVYMSFSTASLALSSFGTNYFKRCVEPVSGLIVFLDQMRAYNWDLFVKHIPATIFSSFCFSNNFSYVS